MSIPAGICMYVFQDLGDGEWGRLTALDFDQFSDRLKDNFDEVTFA